MMVGAIVVGSCYGSRMIARSSAMLPCRPSAYLRPRAHARTGVELGGAARHRDRVGALRQTKHRVRARFPLRVEHERRQHVARRRELHDAHRARRDTPSTRASPRRTRAPTDATSGRSSSSAAKRRPQTTTSSERQRDAARRIGARQADRRRARAARRSRSAARRRRSRDRRTPARTISRSPLASHHAPG